MHHMHLQGPQEKTSPMMRTRDGTTKIGAIAREESKHDSCIQGSDAPGIEEPFGSIMMANFATPSEYVARRVAKSATSVNELKSSRLDTCKVRNNDDKREYANRNGLASREVPFVIRCRNANGVSLCTPPFGPATERSRVFKCSTTFFINWIKCSARLIFPGTLSLSTSGARTFCQKKFKEVVVSKLGQHA